MIKKEDIYFPSYKTGEKMHGIIWNIENPKAILQIVHGMQEYIDRYDEFATYMADKGILVCGEDHMGHGMSVADGGTYGYFCEENPEEELVENTRKMTNIVREKYPDTPIIVMGHSFGSFITRYYLTKYSNDLKGCIISGTGYQDASMIKAGHSFVKFQKLFFPSKHVAKLADKIAFGSYLKKIENPKTPSDWLSYNEEDVAAYRKNPWCNFTFTLNGFDTMFRLLYKVIDKDLMKNISKSLPIFMVAGKEDPVGGYGKDVQKLYNVYKNEIGLNVKLKLYENKRHELHNEPDRMSVYEDYSNWILEVIA